MADIGLHDVVVVKGNVPVLSGVSLDIRDGELFAILGASGSGKTTLLRLVAGLEKPERGHVTFDGVDVTDVPPAERGAAMVFQEDVLLSFRDIAGNIAFPLEIAGTPREDRERRVTAESRVWGLQRVLRRRPGTLSAGQRHVTQAARAMVRAPRAFLLDEPLARLDAHDRERLRREIHTMQRGYGVTTLYVTNDPVEAMSIADRIGVLVDGSMRQVGSPREIYRQPVDRQVAEFVGPMSFVSATVGPDGRGVTIGGRRLAAWAPALEPLAGTTVTVGVRPESIVADDDGIPVRVESAEYAGDHWTLHGRIDTPSNGEPIVWRGAESEKTGARVGLLFRAYHVFHEGLALVNPL